MIGATVACITAPSRMNYASSLNVPSFSGPPGQEDMPYLLTPGPLTTSQATKLAMLADWGSRDVEFRAIVKDIRRRLIELAEAGPAYECVLIQGSGTFAIEAVLGALCPATRRKTLVISNGAYGERAVKILERLGRAHVVLDKGDSAAPSVADVEKLLKLHRSISHIWLVHCETTSGIVNPLEEIARMARLAGKIVMVDSMSAFGALPLKMAEWGIDAMVSSANKCIEGVPGFAYAILRRDLLEASKGKCPSVVLDLHEQWAGFEKNGQFRFTPPTHAIVAFHQALKQHESEGGIVMRGGRYRRNAEVLVRGMRQLGFVTLLPDELSGPIIQTFLMPRDVNFDFDTFYELLRARGFAIYPGKLTKRPSFRIGTIGRLDEQVMNQALRAIEDVLKVMRVKDLAPADA
jgi:2-aminoethylphosphonate-pyruvate transaminase